MQKDILGNALLDYFHGRYTEDIITETNISEEDELPLPYLFREFKEMSELEREALKHCKGKVLDVGCGSGSHTLYLQEKGLEVLAIDRSKGAVNVCRLRGVKKAKNLPLLALKEGTFDTILLLMNGTGIFQNINSVAKYLGHLKSLLHPNGHILIDSSDIIYMFDKDEDEGVWVPTGKDYYGELSFTMTYKGKTSEPFDWLYMDFETLNQYCNENGLDCELILEGDHYDYLAKITFKKEHTT